MWTRDVLQVEMCPEEVLSFASTNYIHTLCCRMMFYGEAERGRFFQVEDCHRESVVNMCRSKREVVVVRGCCRNSHLNRKLSRHVVDRGIVSESGQSKEYVVLRRGIYYADMNKFDDTFIRRESPKIGVRFYGAHEGHVHEEYVDKEVGDGQI